MALVPVHLLLEGDAHSEQVAARGGQEESDVARQRAARAASALKRKDRGDAPVLAPPLGQIADQEATRLLEAPVDDDAVRLPGRRRGARGGARGRPAACD